MRILELICRCPQFRIEIKNAKPYSLSPKNNKKKHYKNCNDQRLEKFPKPYNHNLL